MEMQEGIGRGPIVIAKKSAGKLTRGQRRAARLLVTGLTTTQVAKRLGERRKTIWAWREQPRFAAHEARLEAELDACAQRRAMALLGQAVLTLKRMLKSRNRRTRMFAISAVLKLNERLPQIRERFEYLRRLRDGPPLFVAQTAWRGPQSN